MPVVCSKCSREFRNEQAYRMHHLRVHRKIGSGHGDMAKGGPKARTKQPKAVAASEDVRARMSAAQKKRWRKKRREKAILNEILSLPAPPKGTTLADAINALEIKRDALDEIIRSLKEMA